MFGTLILKAANFWEYKLSIFFNKNLLNVNINVNVNYNIMIATIRCGNDIQNLTNSNRRKCTTKPIYKYCYPCNPTCDYK